MALRSELEHAHELVVPNGVVNTSQTDHVGLDQRASVMGVIKDGKFTYLSPVSPSVRGGALAAALEIRHNR